MLSTELVRYRCICPVRENLKSNKVLILMTLSFLMRQYVPKQPWGVVSDPPSSVRTLGWPSGARLPPKTLSLIYAWVLGLTLALGGQLSAPARASEFLPVEQAFQVSATTDGAQVHVHINIHEGYYLYQERFHFELDDAGNSLLAVSFPKALNHHDDYFGDQSVFRQSLDLTLNAKQTLSADATLKVRLQGCADAGLCYPPKTISLHPELIKTPLAGNTPSTTRASSSSTSTELTDSPAKPALARITDQTVNTSAASSNGVNGNGSEQNHLVTLIRQGSIAKLIGAFLLLGMLLALTPCVLPMVPIIAGLVAGEHSNTNRGFWLSVCYVLGMCITYTAAGVLCALLGSQVQAIFQAPLVIIAFSMVMALMALSMFGWFQVEMPSVVQTQLSAMSSKLAGGGYVKTTAIGALSALIVSACVAPPLVAALSVIGQTGDVLRGGVALGALSLGMGLPLLIVGITAGRFMPKSGPWMLTVKAFFGVLLLIVAVWLLEKIVSAHYMFVLWALVGLIACGVFIRVGDRSLKWIRYPMAAACLALAVLWMAGFYQNHPDPWQPWQSGTTERLAFRSIRSLAELTDSLKSAQDMHRFVMLDVTADWCVSCKEMDRLVFQKPMVIKALEGFELIRVDVTDNTPDDQLLLKRFQLYGPPGTLFFDQSGQELADARLVGFVDAETFIQYVHHLTQGRSTP